MKSYLLEILCIVLFLSSCHSSKKENDLNEKKIEIKINEASKIHFSNIFEQVNYIPLETTDSSLIGTVERLRIFDNKVCLLSDKSLLLFNKQSGNVELQLSKLGSAPEDYKSLYDVYIDNEMGEIELLDMNGKKIQKYNMHGQYKSSLSLPFMSFSFTKTGKSDYWFYNNNLISDQTKSKVIHYDSKERKILEEYFPIDSSLSNFFFVVEGNNFVNKKDGIFFFSCPSQNIYLIDNKLSPQVAYTFDFGKHSIPEEFFKHNFSDIMEFSIEANKREYVYFVNNFALNKEYIMLSFLLDKKCFWSIHNTSNSINIAGNILEDDINTLSHINIDNLNTLITMDEEALYFLISSEQFINMCKDNKEFQKILINNNIIEESNPILVKCTFKKKL